MTLTEYLKTLRYPGRFIVIGRSDGGVLAIYGATGRSAASLARRYVQDGNSDVWAQHTDTKVAQEGNSELLEYRAVRWTDTGFVMANGRQIEGGWETCDPEPDEYHTPRITLDVSYKESHKATLHISRMVGGAVERKRWELQLDVGQGHFISTYTGADVRPTPSFTGDPILVSLDSVSREDVVAKVFDALTPEYRVGVVGVQYEGGARMVAIQNKL